MFEENLAGAYAQAADLGLEQLHIFAAVLLKTVDDLVDVYVLLRNHNRKQFI